MLAFQSQGPRIVIRQADITTLKVEAIVNAANGTLLGGGGVDGAIHRAAGPALLKACRAFPQERGRRCGVGEAKITPGFELPAQWIIHTVGPRYDIDEPSDELLAKAYTSSMALAAEKSLSTLAFPAISCGVYGYPMDEAAEIALETVEACGTADVEITFALFGANALHIWSGVAHDLWPGGLS